MKVNLYVVRDEVMAESWKIGEAKNDLVAWREFEKLMAKQEYATEFKLYRVGAYDHETEEGIFYTKVEIEPSVKMDEQEDE